MNIVEHIILGWVLIAGLTLVTKILWSRKCNRSSATKK